MYSKTSNQDPRIKKFLGLNFLLVLNKNMRGRITCMDKKRIILPSILPGFMELLPKEQVVFDKLLDTIKKGFEVCGFMPIDTPVIEKAEILNAKGGEETERQIYSFKKGDNELSLRYDLTVPLARYVAQRYNDLNFPFKRYQIGKVFRGERQQKGRFREFYQCDIDIIGKDDLSIQADAEILSAIYFIFNRLNIGKFIIKVNNRKVLTGFLSELGLEDKTKETLKILDKLDKIGKDGVVEELERSGVQKKDISRIFEFVDTVGGQKEVIEKLRKLNLVNETFNEGVKELAELYTYASYMKLPLSSWKIDLSLARGLDYYTGTVYEAVLTEYPEIGSLCGGGRYDNLTGYFSDKKMPGVGVSIGLTRLFDQLKEKNLLEDVNSRIFKVLLLPLTEDLEYSYSFLSLLRSGGIASDILITEKEGLKKRLAEADKSGAKFAAIIGEDEIKNKNVSIKDMETGEQRTLGFSEALDFLTKFKNSSR